VPEPSFGGGRPELFPPSFDPGAVLTEPGGRVLVGGVFDRGHERLCLGAQELG